MRSTLYVAVCLVALASSGGRVRAGDEEGVRAWSSDESAGTPSLPNTETSDLPGGGRGEAAGGRAAVAPRDMNSEEMARKAEQRAKDEAAIEEYDHQVFLNDIWTKP